MRMINSNDGGANVSVNGGRTWTNQEFATAQFYHVTTTNHFPYKICGAQQDNSTLCGPSRKTGGITIADWQDAGGGESGYIASSPRDPDIIFAGSYGGLLTRKDMRTGLTNDVNPWPDNPMGHSSEDIKYKFQWTFPIVFSPHDPTVMYVGGSNLFVTRNEGNSYQIMSPPLARNDPKTLGASGGPITKDQTGVETYGVVFTVAESPLTKGVIWTGSDDGLVYLTRDNGKTWKNVTPKDIGDYSRISLIEAGHYAPGVAYVAANRFQQDDFAPILYKTADFGATWTKIVNGIGAQDFARAIREDPVRKGLLYAGTEHGVYVSFNDGANWQSMRLNLPIVPVHDLTIKDGDLIVATHGRSFCASSRRRRRVRRRISTSRATPTALIGVAADLAAVVAVARARTRRAACKCTTRSRTQRRRSRSISSTPQASSSRASARRPTPRQPLRLSRRTKTVRA
jgi:photosystem II stability/assembly factor-like uncharacterized protein